MRAKGHAGGTTHAGAKLGRVRGLAAVVGRRLPRVLLAPIAVALLASCSSSPVPPGASPTSTPPTTSSTSVTTTTALTGPPCGVVPNADIVFTSRTEPCAITTYVGVKIHISLDRGFIWNDPTSDSQVLQVSNIQRPSSGGGLDADLLAEAVGQATLSSAGGIACLPGQPCPALARLWELRVTVTQQ